jgi:uncharacterized membrane protein
MGLDAEAVATGLGWFSIGLGLAELLATRQVARAIGVPDDEKNLRALQGFGMREIASGIGILSARRPAGWVWSRVAGDAMDLAYLGTHMVSKNAGKDRVSVAAAAVVGITVLDVLTGERLNQANANGRGPSGTAMLSDWTGVAGPQTQDRRIRMVRSISVYKPVEDVYRLWRNFENFPRFMSHVEEVRTQGDRRSHWKAKAPLGRTVEWDAEITDDLPNERISWRSVPGSEIENAGSVSFRKAPGDRGTVVHVELGYDPPGGIVGATIARLFGREPGQQVDQDLRRLKAILEVGEVVQSDATAKGWGSGRPPKGQPRPR